MDSNDTNRLDTALYPVEIPIYRGGHTPRSTLAKKYELGTRGHSDECIPPHQHQRFGVDRDQAEELCWLLVLLELSDDVLPNILIPC